MSIYEGGYHSSSSSPLLSGDSSPFSVGTSVFDDEDGGLVSRALSYVGNMVI